ncbi:hypothetical protein QJQ45_015912, partial [Haematococcus lacustris]
QQLDPEQLVEFGETDMDGIELTGLNSFDFFGQSGRPPPTASTPGLLSFARNGEDSSLLASADLAAGSDPAGMEPDLCNATAQALAALTTGGGEGGGEGAHGSSSAVTHGPDPGSGVAGQCGAGRSAAARQASPARPVSDEAQRGAAPPQPHDQAAACEQHLEQRLQEQQEEQQLDQQSRQQEQQEQQHLRRHIVEGEAAAAGESPGQQLHQGGGHTAPGQLDGTASYCTSGQSDAAGCPEPRTQQQCAQALQQEQHWGQHEQQPGHGATPADLTSPHDTQQRASDLQQLGGREQGLPPGSGEPSTSRDSASSLAACGGRPWGKRRERKRMGAESGPPQALAESSSSSQAVAGQQGEVGDALAQVACSHGGPGQQQQQLVGVPPGPCRAVQDLAGPLAPAADLSRSPLMVSPQHQQTSLPTVQLEAEHQAAPAPAAPHVQVRGGCPPHAQPLPPTHQASQLCAPLPQAALTQADTLSPSPSASSSSQGEAASTTHPHPYIPEPVPCMSPAEGQEAGAQQQGVLPAALPGGAAGGGLAGSKETTPAAAGTEAACPPALAPSCAADLGLASAPAPGRLAVEAKGGQGAPGPAEAGDPLDAATLALYAEMQALSALRQALKREFEALGHGQAVAGIDPWQPQDTAAGSAQGGALGQEPGTQAEPSQGQAPPAADSALGEAVEGWGAVARARGSLSEGVTGPACAPALAALPVAAPVQLPSTLADPAAAPSPPRLQSGGQTAPPAPLLRWTLPGLAPAPGSSRPPAAQRSLDRQPPPAHPLQPVAPQPVLPPGAAPQAHAPALPLPRQQLDTAAVAYDSSGATGDEGAGGHATRAAQELPLLRSHTNPLFSTSQGSGVQGSSPGPAASAPPGLDGQQPGPEGLDPTHAHAALQPGADQVAGAAAGSGPGQRGSGVWAGGQAEEQQNEQTGPVLWQGGGPLGVCDGQQGQQGLEATLGAPGMTPAAAPPPFTHHPQTSSQHLDLLHVQQQQLAQGGVQAPPHHLDHPSPQLGHCSSVPGQPDPPPHPHCMLPSVQGAWQQLQHSQAATGQLPHPPQPLQLNPPQAQPPPPPPQWPPAAPPGWAPITLADPQPGPTQPQLSSSLLTHTPPPAWLGPPQAPLLLDTQPLAPTAPAAALLPDPPALHPVAANSPWGTSSPAPSALAAAASAPARPADLVTAGSPQPALPSQPLLHPSFHDPTAQHNLPTQHPPDLPPLPLPLIPPRAALQWALPPPAAPRTSVPHRPPASPPSTSSATTSGLTTQQQTLRSSSAPRQLLLAPHEPTPPGLAYQVPPAQQQQPLAAAQGPWAAPAATGAAGAAGGGKAGQGPEGGGLAEQHSGWHALRPNTLDAPPGSGPAAPGGESSRAGGPGKKPRPAASPARVRGGGAPPALERPLVLEGSYVQAAVEARARAEREAQARAALAPAPRPTALQRSLSDTGPAVGLAAPSWAPGSAADAGSPVQAALAGAHRVQPGTGPQAVPGPYPGQAKAAPPLPQPQGAPLT